MQKSKKIPFAILGLNALLVVLYAIFAYVPAGRELVSQLLVSESVEVTPSDLIVAQAAEFNSLDPQTLAPEDAVAVALVYEPLVRFDEFLNLTPALAYTWYYQDETHFVTSLRSDALFHDGKKLKCADVVATLTRAQKYPASGVRDLFAGVSVAAEDDATCVFTLPAPDYNFLYKLTRLYILPAEIAQASLDSVPTQTIGTGRYRLIDRESATLMFEMYSEYYFPNPKLPRTLALIAESKKYNRLALLRAGKADILLDVPASFVPQIEGRYGYHVTPVPNYEALFLLFNQKNPELGRLSARQNFSAVVRALTLEKTLNDESLYELSQFAPSGVFGFAPELLDEVSATFTSPKEKIFLSLGTTEENKKIAQILQAELLDKNIDLSIHTMSGSDLLNDLKNGKLDLYLVGWRFDLGVIDDFLTKLVHSSTENFGEYNGYGYANPEVDTAIGSALSETTGKKRLRALQEIMIKLVREDVIGVPLLGTRRLYAVRDGLQIFTPRMDGLLLFE